MSRPIITKPVRPVSVFVFVLLSVVPSYAQEPKHRQSLETHTPGYVASVVFSPDGKLLASGGADKIIRIWDVGKGSVVAELRGHGKSITCLAFSPDGKVLASAGREKTIRTWDVGTGKLLATLEGHTDVVWCVSYSPHGKTLASGSADNTIRLWDMGTGRSVATWEVVHGYWALRLAFTPDGETLVSAGVGRKNPSPKKTSSSGSLKLWEVATGKPRATLEPGTGTANSIAVQPDGKLLAAGDSEGKIKLWKLDTGTNIVTLDAGSVESLAFSPDGAVLAVGTGRTNVTLWRVATGKKTADFVAHQLSVRSVAFSPDGKILASAGDRIIGLWEIDGEK